jgi:deoxyribodipyrimidine photolyase
MVEMGGVNSGITAAVQGLGDASRVAREVFQKSDEFCREIDRQMEQHQLEQMQETLQRIRNTLARLGLEGVVASGQDLETTIASISRLRNSIQGVLDNPTVALTGQQMRGLEQTRDQLDEVLRRLTADSL